MFDTNRQCLFLYMCMYAHFCIYVLKAITLNEKLSLFKRSLKKINVKVIKVMYFKLIT